MYSQKQDNYLISQDGTFTGFVFYWKWMHYSEKSKQILLSGQGICAVKELLNDAMPPKFCRWKNGDKCIHGNQANYLVKQNDVFTGFTFYRSVNALFKN